MRRARWSIRLLIIFLLVSRIAQAEMVPSLMSSIVVSTTQSHKETSLVCGNDGRARYFSDYSSDGAVAKFMSKIKESTCNSFPTSSVVFTDSYASDITEASFLLNNICYPYEHYCTNKTEIISTISGCLAPSVWNGTACVETRYSCPTTGTWTLSSDKQTCTGCWDASKIPNAEGGCVSPGDKGAGADCQNTITDHPRFWSE